MRITIWTRFLINTYLRNICIIFLLLFILCAVATLVKFIRITNTPIPIYPYLFILLIQSLNIFLHGVPFVLILSTILSLHYLKYKNLLIVFNCAKRKPINILAPFLGISFIIGALQVFFITPLYILAKEKNDFLINQYFHKKKTPTSIASGYWFFKPKKMLININTINNDQLRDIRVFFMSNNSIEKILYAKSGLLINNQYVLKNSIMITLTGNRKIIPQYIIPTSLNKKTSPPLNKIFNNPYHNIYTLLSYIHILKLLGLPYYKQESEFYIQITKPIFYMLFVISASIFMIKSIKPRQQQTTQNIILSLIIGFGLYTILQVISNISQSGQYSAGNMILGSLFVMALLIGLIWSVVIY